MIDLEGIVERKDEFVYPSHIQYRVLIPAGENIEARLDIPTGWVYIVVGEIHDVPSECFTHACEKDGRKVLPETLIDGTSMVLNYAEPFLVERYWLGVIRNVSDCDEIFRLRVVFLVCPTKYIEMARRRIALKREIEEIWRKLTFEEKVAIIKRAPEIVLALAR